MNQYFRDTVFGQVVRLASRNNFLKFPDEQDPTLWKQCVQKHAAGTSLTFQVQGEANGSKDRTAADVSDGGEKGQDQGTDMTSTPGSAQRHNSSQRSNLTHEKTGAQLVDWYGPDDAEV